MKKALALIVAALLLCGCADSTKNNPEVTPEASPEITTEGAAAQDAQSDAESVAEDVIWIDMYDPIDDARSQEIKELLGIESLNEVRHADCVMSEDYTLKSYYISDLHLVGYVIDTNYPQNFTVQITGIQSNPETGEEKAIKASTQGNHRALLVVYADEGYVIKSYKITNDFKTRPLLIEKELSDEDIENGFLKERFAQIDESEHEKYIQEYYCQRFSGKSWYDYADQISEDGEYYQLEGDRSSVYPMALGFDHDHIDCDDSDAELMALGERMLAAAVKIDTLINGHAMRDLSNELPIEGYDEGYFAISEEFGDYESIMELYKNSFSPEVGVHSGYYAAEKPDELLYDYSSIGTVDENGEVVKAENLSVALERSMVVHDGVTYETGTGLYDTRVDETKLCGVLSHTDTHIEYGLCTAAIDEEGEILLNELGINCAMQFRYEHSVMVLDLIDGRWLITQVRECLGEKDEFLDKYCYNN